MLAPNAMDLRPLAHWVASRLEEIEHEQRVVRIASTLFDLTAGLHQLDPRARNLLRAAALVHDVGRSIDKARHPAIGARLILRERTLNLSDADRRALAFLTLYHRDAVPAPDKEAILHNDDDRACLRKILALLRVADALDSRSLESPRIFFGLKRKRLNITCYFRDLTAKARRIYLRRKKFRLLEGELGCVVEIDLRSAEALTLVA
jgi:exopolyphosphatase/pppGpp-phosphohydrolase